MHPILKKRCILISAKCAQKTMRIYFYSLTYQIFCLGIRGVTYQQTFIKIYYTYWPNYPHFKQISLHASVYNNAVTTETARPSLIQLLFFT